MPALPNDRAPQQPGRNSYNNIEGTSGLNVPTGKHRVNGGSSWLASSKAASLPFHSSNTMSPAKWSNLKRLLAKYWSSESSSLSKRTPRQPSPLSFDGYTMPAAATTRFMLLCSLWYTTSALSSNTGKAILTQFRYPVTLTFIQFGFVASYCLLFMSPAVRFSRLRMPTKAIIRCTLPMGMFQVGGHMFSSMAISRIPVSTVHTIKVCLHCFILRYRQPNTDLGPVPSFYGGCLRLTLWGLLFRYNLLLSPSADHRRNVSLYIRHVRVEHHRPPLCIRLRPRLCIFQYLLQEDNAVSFQVNQPLATLSQTGQT